MTGQEDVAGAVAAPFRLLDDLAYLVIDQLRDDKPTLVACSLVCSAWLYRSQRNLFRSITIKNYPCRFEIIDRSYEFFRFLQGGTEDKSTPKTHIMNSIRHLELKGWMPYDKIPPYPTKSADALPLTLLRAYLTILPNLESLALRGRYIADDYPVHPTESLLGSSHLSSFFRPLNALTIQRYDSPSRRDLPHLFNFIGLFPRIESLSLSGLWDPPFPLANLLSHAQRGPVINKLEVDTLASPLAAVLYDLLRRSGCLSGHLTEVSFSGRWTDQSSDDTTVFSPFLHDVGAGLLVLKLKLPDETLDWMLHNGPALSLRSCTMLQSLTLAMEFDEDSLVVREWLGSCYDTSFRAYGVLLEHDIAFLQALREVVFPLTGGSFAVQNFPLVTAIPETWAGLDDTLVKLPALECVRFVFVSYSFDKIPLTGEEVLRRSAEGCLPLVGTNRRIDVPFKVR
ncbi:hypothetical protein L227DRAFT_574400 [Lentinus tigrinus ALCF2SS1-6]|uniref:F-box domain-containing protein n=1 Tax=Lentinus tigrinus ALCF2SS1-6 TaxID=1328759 RepID=A0A5C2SCC6_9APHY|nr:hypothetical protein L227DRAFT_574400 [Lentinus tigrinus ALCF2SS1-6]